MKQYSPSGKLLQVLGTPGNAGSSLNPLQFDQPAEVFVEESGEMYVVDGDGGMNNRLLKLSEGMEKYSKKTNILIIDDKKLREFICSCFRDKG